jgi:hypothetical protein
MKVSCELDQAANPASHAAPDASANASAVSAKAVDGNLRIVRHRLLAAFAIACFAVAVMIASSVSGQEANNQYDSIQINPRIDTAAAAKTMKGETRAFASTGKGNGNAVKAYFEQYVPGKMTAPDGVEHLSEIVDDVTGYLERANKGSRPDVALGLTRLTFDSMNKVATGNYHPTARIAAAVMLGRLVSKSVDVGNKKPPIPLAAALPVLVSLYEDESNVDGLRAAALQGIHRHAMYSFDTMPADVKTKLTTLMNDLLDSNAPNHRDIQAHAFLQRYAVDILDYTSADQNAALGMKLVSISTEPNSPEMIALHSASRLATMSKAIENKIDDPKKVLSSWTARTLTAFENEIARIEGMKKRQTNVRQPQDPSTHLRKPEDLDRKTAMGRGGMGGMGGMDDMMMGDDYGMMMGDDYGMDDMSGMDDMYGEMGGFRGQMPKIVQDPEITATRRKLNHVLQQVHLGVTGIPKAEMPSGKSGGLLGSADDATKKVIEKWVEAMADVIEEINDPYIEKTPEFLIALKEQIEPLQELLGSLTDDAGNAFPKPKPKAGVADDLKAELMDDANLDADLMAEPVLQP